MTTYPIFLDIEASGLIIDSYPIEIAWNDANGEITSFLINPYKEWNYWSNEAEELHRIKRTELESKGISIQEACDKLDEKLLGGYVYSDAPFYERQWLDKLYDTAMRKRSFTVKNIEEITEIHHACKITNSENKYDAFVSQAFQELGNQHRADVDVKSHMRVYELCKLHLGAK